MELYNFTKLKFQVIFYWTLSGEQSANNDTELHSSEMFIENESDTNPVATTNENQSGKVPCDSDTNNKQYYHAQWAGANNPLWVVRSTKNLTGFENLSGLEEVKPDKMPIAIYERMEIFTNHEIELSKGDTLYLMTDGYEDQFGGPKGKKFLSKNLKELIIANCLLTMEEQKQILEKTLVEWIGEGEQIDDITLLGIRI